MRTPGLFCLILIGILPAAAEPPVLLRMIRDDAVRGELDLSTSQASEIDAAMDRVDGDWFRARILPEGERDRINGELTGRLRDAIKPVLEPDQRRRLDQLERQALGTRMLTRDDVADVLEIDAGQRARLIDVFEDTDREAASADTPGAGEKLKDRERTRIGEILRDDQRRGIARLIGTPFDFSRVVRTLPRAPEISDEGLTWVRGEPVTLGDLRGKVVALHFYAHECINCVRNLPHYNAWHDDYADDGLVVIGIQTPEISSERKADRVAAAADDAGIEYRVGLDLESSNWKRWSNTMWPTVYLIDRRGYLRRWWQGEMNWQGTPGEQQMRETIEQLLAESP